MFKSQDDNPASFTVKLDDVNFRLDQDVSAYRDYAHKVRELNAMGRSHYRQVCIIPDIVAVDILTKYGLDIHAPDFMNDTEKKRRLMTIIRLDYPDLLTSNIRRT